VAAPAAPTLRLRAAARAALRAHTADPYPGVRAACLSGLVNAAARGLALPAAAHEAAVGGLADDAPAVRLAAVHLLGAAAARAGATAAPGSRQTTHHATPIAARRSAAAADRAAAAADAAFAAAAWALADPHPPVRVAALAVLGSLAAASPPVKAGALSKKSTARTMEGQSVDDAALVVGPGAACGGLGLLPGEGGGGGGGEGGSGGGGGPDAAAAHPASPTLAPAAVAAAAAAAAAVAADDWASYAGAFVHGLEDDAAAVRSAALGAMAALGGADPAWAPLAAPFAADCAGDESPGVRAAALTALAALCGAGGGSPLDPHLGAALAGLADTDGAVRAAACGLLGGGGARLTSLASLGAAVDALLEAALADTRAGEPLGSGGGGGRTAGRQTTPLAALARLGASAPGPAAALIPNLMGTRSGFIQAEPSVDNPAYAARLAFALAACAGGAHPALGALLPSHALGGAAVVLAGRLPGLPLPVGGVVPLGRGAVLVGQRRALKKRAREGGGEAAGALAAIGAALATLTGPTSAASLADVDAALAPLMEDPAAPAAGAAAAGRLYVRALAVLGAVQEEGGGGGGGGGDGPSSLPAAWLDASALRLPSLTDACTPVPAPIAASRLDRLADLMACGLGGGEASAGAAVGGLEAAAASLRSDGALPGPPRPPPPPPVANLVIVRGELAAPGGRHARPVAGVAGLPLRLPLAGRVVSAGVGGGGEPPRAWLSLADPASASPPLLLPLHLVEEEGEEEDEGGGGGGARAFALPPYVDAPAAPGPPGGGSTPLIVALLVQAGRRVGVGGRAVLVQVAPGRPVRVEAGRAADAHRT